MLFNVTKKKLKYGWLVVSKIKVYRYGFISTCCAFKKLTFFERLIKCLKFWLLPNANGEEAFQIIIVIVDNFLIRKWCLCLRKLIGNLFLKGGESPHLKNFLWENGFPEFPNKILPLSCEKVGEKFSETFSSGSKNFPSTISKNFHQKFLHENGKKKFWFSFLEYSAKLLFPKKFFEVGRLFYPSKRVSRWISLSMTSLLV